MFDKFLPVLFPNWRKKKRRSLASLPTLSVVLSVNTICTACLAGGGEPEGTVPVGQPALASLWRF